MKTSLMRSRYGSLAGDETFPARKRAELPMTSPASSALAKRLDAIPLAGELLSQCGQLALSAIGPPTLNSDPSLEFLDRRLESSGALMLMRGEGSHLVQFGVEPSVPTRKVSRFRHNSSSEEASSLGHALALRSATSVSSVSRASALRWHSGQSTAAPRRFHPNRSKRLRRRLRPPSTDCTKSQPLHPQDSVLALGRSRKASMRFPLS